MFSMPYAWGRLSRPQFIYFKTYTWGLFRGTIETVKVGSLFKLYFVNETQHLAGRSTKGFSQWDKLQRCEHRNRCERRKIPFRACRWWCAQRPGCHAASLLREQRTYNIWNCVALARSKSPEAQRNQTGPTSIEGKAFANDNCLLSYLIPTSHLPNS